MQFPFQPMPFSRGPGPFNHPAWLFELKYDGFRALARIKRGQCELISRNGHPFSSFAELGKSIAVALPHLQDAVLDGEIVCLDRKGRPQFNDLLFKRSQPCFFAFDVLYADGKDFRGDALIERKVELRRFLHRASTDSQLRYEDHVEGSGIALFQRLCRLDLEGIVAKYKFSPYGGEDSLGTWYKIRNRDYSQMIGREKLFERDRHKEPVPGWHTCELACAEA